MSLGSLLKDPTDVVDVVIDWADWLDGDTISTSSWTLPDGVTQSAESETSTTATLKVSGGTAGQDYTVANTIVTAGGLTAERSVRLMVRQL